MPPSHDEIFARLGDFIREKMEATGVPGVSIGVMHGDKVFADGYGVTNVDHPLPVNGETLFQVGSITKTFTATLIMRLVERGQVDLDATVRAYLPGFRVADEKATSQATVRHLLTHTGGWVGDYFHDTGRGDDALSRYVADMADLEQLVPTGTEWSYNNAGFAVAGSLVEEVTGKNYETALRELILDPLGLRSCYFDPADVMAHRFVVGHSVGDNGVEVSHPWGLPRSIYPVGGMVSNVKELLRYGRFHMGDGLAENGTRLLRPESLSQMRAKQVAIEGAHEAIGLSWFLMHTNGELSLSHAGGTRGQISLLLLVPERQFAVAILTNCEEGGRITLDASRWALKHYLGLEKADPKPLGLPKDKLGTFTGRYERPFQDVELYLEDSQLIAQLTPKGGFPTEDTPPSPAPPPMTCAFYGEDRLIVLDGTYRDARGEFIRAADGSIAWLRFSSRIHKRVG